jgi:membrane associated rhomboid family serine protease
VGASTWTATAGTGFECSSDSSVITKQAASMEWCIGRFVVVPVRFMLGSSWCMEAPSVNTSPSRIPRTFLPVAIAVAMMWLVEILDVATPLKLDRHGIVPRRVGGLDGIAFAPFLHVSFRHLIANSIPLVVLGSIISIQRVSRFVSVFVLTALGSGVGVWLVSPARTVTIGASGVVFGLLGYLLARGFFDRKPTSVLVGILALLFYGGMLFGVLPNRAGVSWQAHLFGFIAGVCSAWLLDGRHGRSSVATTG